MPPKKKEEEKGTAKITTFFTLKKKGSSNDSSNNTNNTNSSSSTSPSVKLKSTSSSEDSKNKRKRDSKSNSIDFELSSDDDEEDVKLSKTTTPTKQQSTPTKKSTKQSAASTTVQPHELSEDSDLDSKKKETKTTTPTRPNTRSQSKAMTPEKKSSTPVKTSSSNSEKKTKSPAKTTPTKQSTKKSKVIADDEDDEDDDKDDDFNEDIEETIPSSKKRKMTVPTPEKKKKSFFDKSAHENKTRAKNPGCKQVPKGKPMFLEKKAFVITGQMESLDREELEDLIKQYGGFVRTNVSGKTDYVIVGDDPGESKMKKARECKTKQISEDDFLEMIRKSNPDGKYDEDGDVAMQDAKPSPRAKSEKVTKSSKPKTSDNALSSVVQVSKEVVKARNGDNDQLWVEKYKPDTSQQIIGHKQEFNTLLDWLKNWHENYEKESNKAAETKGRKKAASSDWKRAAFLSGPPGIGKSTTAAIVAREAGFTHIIEMNASDARSKKAMKEEVVEICLSKSIKDFFGKPKTSSSSDKKKQTILIMDEVDGMSSGDRGGVAELVQIIKQTRVPIICIANDRSKPNLKTLIANCLDVKFSRPNKATIAKRILEICKQEKLSIDFNAVEYLVESLNNDIRSVLNNLQLINRYSTKDHIAYKDAKENDVTKTSTTDGIFDVVRDVFAPSNKTYNERLEDYHFDSMLVPLFVEQNYINIRPSGVSDKERMDRIALSSDSISMGDVVGAKMFRNMQFGNMNTHAFYSTLYPAYFVRGSFQSLRAYDRYFQFPMVLGKGSTTTKNYNLLRAIQKSTSLKASADTKEMLDYLPLLSKTLLTPLLEGGKDNVDETIEAMDEYQISRDELEFMCELTTFKGKNVSDTHKDWFSQVDSKTKTALTKQYNKVHKGFNKVTAAMASHSEKDDEELNSGDEDEEDDIQLDKFVSKMKSINKLESFEKKREKADKKKEKASSSGSTKKTSSTRKETNKKKK
ncbi:hypothetical protein C9374_012822 [Naegleria lovaniensis]|uniref:Replication factor C subunit 1 n=1 Tax=Naegleria lovaniensis TaxID=51637 RepID=A0AA88GCR9_NAELO|nr:uncharacterized protein C9374_012822 [Naegleria lovaniensis]KAG2373090.1 hypothetical protein C9374_012822 [Naegleria lovaniensis]